MADIAKRLLPLIGMGASVGAIIGGASVAPAAYRLGTSHLLVISAVLLAIALPLLWLVPEPDRDDDEAREDEGFGEMAILDKETHSATATAAEATTLLRIDQDSFDRLIEQNPAVARGIYRVLIQSLRNTLAQVAAG